MIKILHIGQHGPALLPCLGKTNFFTPFYFESSLGVFMKVVDRGVIFQMALVLPILDIFNFNYD